MKKNYFNPTTKVITVKVNAAIMENGINTASKIQENTYKDTPLF